HLGELRIVHVDLVRAGQPPARLDQRAVGVLLLRSHLIVGDLGIASEGRRVGHGAVSCAEALDGGYGWREEALGLTSRRGGVAQDDVRSRRPAVDLSALPNSPKSTSATSRH